MGKKLVRLTLLAALGALSALPTSASSKELTKEQRAAISKAMQTFGWSIPVCAWPIRKTSHAYCMSVYELTRRYPFHTAYITGNVARALGDAYRTRNLTDTIPQDILDKLLASGINFGCVPRGSNRGPMTLGGLSTATGPGNIPILGRGDILGKDCDKTTPRDPVMGLLVGSAPFTPPLAPGSPEGLPTYQQHLAECQAQRQESRNANIANRPLSDDTVAGETEEEKKKRLAEKAVADALAAAAVTAKVKATAAQKEADKKKKEAKEAEEQAKAADQAARDALGNPNVSTADKTKAARASVTAANNAQAANLDAAAAQDRADQAKAEAVAADKALKDYYIDDLKYAAATTGTDNLAIDAAVTGTGILIDVATGGAGAGTVIATGLDMLVHLVTIDAALAGRYWGRRDCADESCAASCEQEAKAKAIRDAVYAGRDKACNFNVMPLPDNDRCYDRPGGIFAPTPTAAVRAVEWLCSRFAKDSPCEGRGPQMFRDGKFDPCNSPVGMCSPDHNKTAGQGVIGGGGQPPNPPQGGRIPSVALPARNVNSSMPGMWTSPAR